MSDTDPGLPDAIQRVLVEMCSAECAVARCHAQAERIARVARKDVPDGIRQARADELEEAADAGQDFLDDDPVVPWEFLRNRAAAIREGRA